MNNSYRKILETIKKFQILGFILISAGLGIIYWYFNKILLLDALYEPTLIIPRFFSNLISSFNVHKLLTYDYFWNFHNISIGVFILTFTIINTLFIWMLLHKRKRTYAAYIILTFFTLALALKAISYFKEYFSTTQLISGGGNIYPFVQDVWVIIVGLLVFVFLKKISIKEMLIQSIPYVIFILETAITLFIGLVTINRITSSGTNIINKYLFPIFAIILGFYFYIILESLKRYLIAKFQIKD